MSDVICNQLCKYLSHTTIWSALKFMMQKPYDVQAKCWCLKHNKLCRRYQADLKALSIEVAGSPCVGFSLMGSGWRFLDNSVLVFLAWIYMMRSVRPLVIIHECTPLFPYKVFELLLNTGISDPQQHYTVNSMISCSTSLGVPCKRKRRYTVLCCNRRAGAFISRPFSEEHFHEVAAVPLELDGLVFFRDSRDAVADHKAYFARDMLNMSPSSASLTKHII